MESGIDPKSYEYFAGHSLAVALKHYQCMDDLRAQKAAPKILEALQGINAGTQFDTQQVHILVHGNLPQTMADVRKSDNLSREKNGLSLENRAYYKKLKTPCDNLQGDDKKHQIAAQGLEPRTRGL